MAGVTTLLVELVSVFWATTAPATDPAVRLLK
jgi:hypothetical protein